MTDNRQYNSDSYDGATGSTSYAFLVHSQESLGQHTKPSIDNQRLARQKRKRTSPEDHAILEAEYENNPKPDKAKRLEIVSKVALGEKEVQIWFQNRRQVTRRKSRPLSPHEIFANLQPASQANSNETPSSSRSTSGSSQPTSQSSLSSGPLLDHDHKSPPYSSQDPEHASKVQRVACETSEFEDVGIRSEDATDLPERQGNIGAVCQKVSSTETSSIDAFSTLNAGPARSQVQVKPPRTRRLVSRGFDIHDDEDDREAGQSLSKDHDAGSWDHDSAASHCLRRTSSLVRLSLSFNGKAEVTTRTGATPSPPRAQLSPLSSLSQRPHAALQRSFSAVEPGERNPMSARSSLKRTSTGRSRDARTWEFYCDKEAQNALTEQAEREESGSATAAIALIKSNSGTAKALTPNAHKRNTNPRKPDTTKRLKPNGQPVSNPKLTRCKSSIADMQTCKKTSFLQGVKAHRKSGSQSAVWELYEGDSDKENWIPGTSASAIPRRRPVDKVQARRTLQESLAPCTGTRPSSHRRGATSVKSTSAHSDDENHDNKEKENEVPDVDDEVAAFMGPTDSSREADDLDCVQGLLSLSQAAWQ